MLLSWPPRTIGISDAADRARQGKAVQQQQQQQHSFGRRRGADHLRLPRYSE
eukprot:jgi/Psemu1/49482/gm1.49482_g